MQITTSIHALIEHYGLLAVFVACVFEGETAAVLAGFFSHQGVFAPWQAFAITAIGAFGGDASFFLIGRKFAGHWLVKKMRTKPGFSHAHALIQSHPNMFVFSNRYIYGMRLLGGIVAGLSQISATRFVIINAISSIVWASVFYGMGYFFGIGAERLIGAELHGHQRLLLALVIGVVVLLVGHLAVRWTLRRRSAAIQSEE